MDKQFLILALWKLRSESVGTWNLEILLEDSDTSSLDYSFDRILICLSILICELCVEKRWRGDRKQYFVNFCFFLGALIVNGEGLWGGAESIGPAEIATFINRFGWKSWVRGEYLAFQPNGSGVKQRSEKGRWVQDFLLLPQGFESIPTDLRREKWSDLVRVECL